MRSILTAKNSSSFEEAEGTIVSDPNADSLDTDIEDSVDVNENESNKIEE